MSPSLFSRIVGGLKTMAGYVAFATLLALFGYLLEPEAFGKGDYPTLRQLLTLYVALGVVGGIALGLFRKHAIGRLRTAAVGIAVALPMTLTLMLYVVDWRVGEMDGFHFVVAVFLALVFGPLVALYVQWQSRRGWNPLRDA